MVAEFIGHNRRDMETLTDTSVAMLNRRLVLSINNIDAGYVAEAEMIGEKGARSGLMSCAPTDAAVALLQKLLPETRYGNCCGTESLRYVDRIMTYYDILKREAIL